MIPSGDRRSPSLWLGGLLIMPVLALLLAAGLEIEGLEQSRKEHIESQEWPAVPATVVECGFNYSVNGAAHEAMGETIGNHHSIRHPAQLPDDALRMETWARRHKKGSTQVIHYDRANPAKISLAGPDDEIRTNAAATDLTSARQAGLLGIVFLPIALIARRMTGQREKSHTGSNP